MKGMFSVALQALVLVSVLILLTPKSAHAGEGGNGSGGAILYQYPVVNLTEVFSNLAASVERLDQFSLSIAGAPSNWTAHRIADVIRNAKVASYVITKERLSSMTLLSHDSESETITVNLEFKLYFGVFLHTDPKEVTRMMNEAILKEVALLWEVDETRAADFATALSYRIQALRP